MNPNIVDATAATYRLRGILGDVQATYLGMRVPSRAWLAIWALVTAAWVGIEPAWFVPVAGAASLLLFTLGWHDTPSGLKLTVIISSTAALALCVGCSCGLLDPEALVLTGIFAGLALALICCAVSMRRHLSFSGWLISTAAVASDQELIEAMPESSAELAVRWVEGALRSSPEVELVVRLATLHALIQLTIHKFCRV